MRKATTPTGTTSKSPVPVPQAKRGISPNTAHPREVGATTPSGGKFAGGAGFSTAQNFYQ